MSGNQLQSDSSTTYTTTAEQHATTIMQHNRKTNPTWQIYVEFFRRFKQTNMKSMYNANTKTSQTNKNEIYTAPQKKFLPNITKI